MTAYQLTGDRDADAAGLIAIYDRRVQQQHAAAADTTAAALEAVMATGLELVAAAEVFRRRYYPRRHRVAVGLWSVFVVSRTGRSIERVLDLAERYRASEVTS